MLSRYRDSGCDEEGMRADVGYSHLDVANARLRSCLRKYARPSTSDGSLRFYGRVGSTLHSNDALRFNFDWWQYGDADPRWAMCPIVSFFTLGKPNAPFVPAGVETSFTYVEHKQSFKIAILADWGAPNEAAKEISAQTKAHEPGYVIHLGDVYDSGTQAECQAVIDMWPLTKPDGTPVVDHSFALNGNHEMFCGARNYFGTILKAFHQPASFFKLKTQYWQIIGLDTAYTGGSLSHIEVQSQWNWLVANLRDNPLLSTVLLTHHQPVSGHTQESHKARALKADADNLLSITRKDAIYGWFFGHEHRALAYDDSVTGYKAGAHRQWSRPPRCSERNST